MTKVKLIVYDLEYDDVSLLSPRMDEKDLKIEKLIIGVIRNTNIDGAIKLIQERDNRGLNYLAIEDIMSDSQRKKILDQLKRQSITTFELKYYNIDCVNPLLEWKLIAEKQIFVIIDVIGDHSKYHSDAVLSLLKRLCKNIWQLFVQQIELDVKILFKRVKDKRIFDSYESIYSSYFENDKFLSTYNKPRYHSHLCLPRGNPYTYFYINNSEKEKYFVFRATNVQSNQKHVLVK